MGEKTRSSRSMAGTGTLNASQERFSLSPGIANKQSGQSLADLARMSDELVPRMQSALSAGHYDQLTRMANLLKGAARHADCQAIYNLAALLESMGVTDTLSAAPVTLAILKTELQHVLQRGMSSDRGTPQTSGDQCDDLTTPAFRRTRGGAGR